MAASPERSPSYEIHLLERGRWTITALFDDTQDARTRFAALAGSGRYQGVRLVKEFYVAGQNEPSIAVIKDTTIKDQMPDRSTLRTGSAKTLVGHKAGAKLAKAVRTHSHTMAALRNRPQPPPTPQVPQQPPPATGWWVYALGGTIAGFAFLLGFFAITLG
ncbi:MAG: hypothetical protein ACFB6S_19495 [Geminicoccaceae bacterium]